VVKSKLPGRDNDRLQMAERYALEGKKDQAAELFAALGDFSRAARLAAELGDERRTVAWSLKGALGRVPRELAGASPKQAGELLAAAGHHGQAVGLFELAREFRKAADCAVKLNQVARAARLYERGGVLEEAARLYEKVGLPEEALRALARASERLDQELAGGRDPALLDRLRQLTSQRVGLLVQLGREEEARALRQDVHPAVQRGRGLERSGRHAEAIEAYLEADRPDLAGEVIARRAVDRRLAAEVYQRAGRHLEAGHLFAALGDARAAAQAYENAGDEEKAGRQWELGRDPERAAHSFLRIGRVGEAARCFIMAGQPALAALSYAKLGDFKSAADCYLRAGQPLEAAKQLLACGERTRAARTLIGIPAESPEGAQATLLLVPQLIEEGFFDDALRRLRLPRLGAAATPPAAEAAERLFWEGRALEGLGRRYEAREAYRQVRALDPAFPTVEARLSALDAALAPVLAPALSQAAARGAPGERTGAGAVATLGSGEMPLSGGPEAWGARGEAVDGGPRGGGTVGGAGAGSLAGPGTVSLGGAGADAGAAPTGGAGTGSIGGVGAGSLGGASAEAGVMPVGGAGTGSIGEVGAGSLGGRVAEPRADSFWIVPQVGDRFAGRYELVAELGRGGMGRVFKAIDHDLGVTVAIKTLLSPPDANPVESDRLLREIQICRQITHPNIVRVYDLGRFRGGIFITMEHLEGQSLDALVDRQNPLPLARLRHLLSEIAAGLEEAHSLGVIHRDLKPTNVMVTPTRAKILDFGLAQMAGFDNRLTQTGFIIGTPMYMSPEMVLGKPLDARSDLYSLGVIAYTMIAGQEPFDGPAATAIAIQQVQAAPPDIRRFRASLPEAWIALIGRLLAKNPAERPGSAREVIAELGALPVPE
jgi:tetratricopeptide (TPR) repeat protein